MVAKIPLRLCQFCMFLTLAVPQIVAQQSGHVNESGAVKLAKPREGLLDFGLQKINSSDRDFGQCLHEGRRILLEETIERGYFWSNVAALGLLGTFLIVIIHQQRLQRRRELIVSESLTQYHNALIRAEARAAEATRRNHALMEALTALPEACIPIEKEERVAPTDVPGKERKASRSSEGKESALKIAPAVAAANWERRKPGIGPSSVAKNGQAKNFQQPDPITLLEDGTDLTAKINALQQQVDTYKEEKQQLLRQVSFAELRLQKEQEKNRSLKGE